MAALGESDPTYTTLQEALKKAKALTHVRPVDERIASSRTFTDRAKKRIGICREQVVRAQEVLAQAQAKLQSEEQSLVEGEARLAALIRNQRVEGGSSSDLASHHFRPRVGGMRACVSQLRQENSDLRCELQSGGRGGEERDRKQVRNLSHSTLDLAPLNQTRQTCQSQPILNTGRADASTRMETSIETADASLRSNRFNPLAR